LRPRKLIMKNLRLKYVYAEYQGYYVAKLIQRMSLSQRVMVAGDSYGGITSATAMHWLGGGCLRGLTLEGGAPVERPNLHAGIIAGAFDSDMLYPGHRFGQAFVAAEKILVTRNIKDRTLKKWHKVSLRGCPAIGSIGVNARNLGQYRSKLCQKTMTQDVHRSHYLKPHLKSTRFVRALCCLSFPSCQACQVTETADEPVESSLARGEGDRPSNEARAAETQDRQLVGGCCKDGSLGSGRNKVASLEKTKGVFLHLLVLWQRLVDAFDLSKVGRTG